MPNNTPPTKKQKDDLYYGKADQEEQNRLVSKIYWEVKNTEAQKWANLCERKIREARQQEREEVLREVKLEKKPVDYFPMAYKPTKDELYGQQEAVGYNQAVKDLEQLKEKMGGEK